MDPDQAVAVLTQACQSVSTTLAQHQVIQQALQTVRELVLASQPVEATVVSDNGENRAQRRSRAKT